MGSQSCLDMEGQAFFRSARSLFLVHAKILEIFIRKNPSYWISNVASSNIIPSKCTSPAWSFSCNARLAIKNLSSVFEFLQQIAISRGTSISISLWRFKSHSPALSRTHVPNIWYFRPSPTPTCITPGSLPQNPARNKTSGTITMFTVESSSINSASRLNKPRISP